TAQCSNCRRRNRIHAGLFRFFVKPMRILSLGKFETAAAAAENNSDSLALFHGEQFRIELCVIQSLVCSNDRKCGRARHVLSFFRVEICEGIDAAHLAGNLNGKWRRIECRDAPNAAACVSKSIPQFCARISKRSDTADAAYDDSAGSPPAGCNE